MPTQRTASRFVRLAVEATRRAAPDEHIERCLSLAVHLANQYKGYGRTIGLEWEDLQGVACLALVEAARSYPDSEAYAAGKAFDAYASVVIRTNLREAIRAASPAKVTDRAWRYIAELRDVEKRLTHGEHLPTEEEIAKELGWDVARVRHYRQVVEAARNWHSIYAPIQEGDEDLFGDTLADPEADHEEQIVNQMDREAERQWLTEAIDGLPPLTRKGVSLMFGFPTPGSQTVAVEDVMRIAVNMANVGKGLQKLRERRRDERGDLPEMVSSSGRTPYSGTKVAGGVTGEDGPRRAIDIWRRYSSGPEAPPVLTA